jgi:hypothetical protein
MQVEPSTVAGVDLIGPNALQIREALKLLLGREPDNVISVFTRGADGSGRHFQTAHPSMAEDIRKRGIDLLTPVYNMLDLNRRGEEAGMRPLKYLSAFIIRSLQNLARLSAGRLLKVLGSSRGS